MVIAGKVPASFNIRKLIALGPRDLKEFFFAGRLADTIPHDQRQIPCRRRVRPVLVAAVKPVRRHKIRAFTPQVLCFLIHQTGELLHRPGNPLCDHHRAVIVRFQHQGIQKISQIELLLFFHTEPYLRLSRRVRRRRDDLISFLALQRQDTSHDLRRTRHRPHHVFFFSKQNTPTVSIHKHC